MSCNQFGKQLLTRLVTCIIIIIFVKMYLSIFPFLLRFIRKKVKKKGFVELEHFISPLSKIFHCVCERNRSDMMSTSKLKNYQFIRAFQSDRAPCHPGGRNRWLLCACSRWVRPPLYNATVRYTVPSNI